MLYCNLQVLLCTEIAVQEDFVPSNMTSEGTSGWGLKKFSTLAIARHILRPLRKLWYDSTTAQDSPYSSSI